MKEQFILYAYEVFYSAMGLQIAEHGFGDLRAILKRWTPVPGKFV